MRQRSVHGRQEEFGLGASAGGGSSEGEIQMEFDHLAECFSLEAFKGLKVSIDRVEASARCWKVAATHTSASVPLSHPFGGGAPEQAELLLELRITFPWQ